MFGGIERQEGEVSVIQLRHPSVVVYLPNPDFGNSIEPQHEILKSYSISGQKYTYVKRSRTDKILYALVLTRSKAKELEAFISLFLNDLITLVTFTDQRYRGYILNNPFEYRQSRRGGPCGDLVDVNLEFEGEKLIS